MARHTHQIYLLPISKPSPVLCCVFLQQVDCSRYPNTTNEEGKVVLRCNTDLSPVCGTDGVTYDNECLMCARNLWVLCVQSSPVRDNECLALLAAALLNIKTSTKAFSVRCLDFDPPLSLVTRPCFPLCLEGKLCLWSRKRSRRLGWDLTQDRMFLLTKLKGSMWQTLPCREQQLT